MCKIGVPGGRRKDEQSEDGIASVRMWGGYDFAEVRERHAFSAQRVSGAESEARCGTKIRGLRFGQAPLFGSLQGEARSVGVPGGSRKDEQSEDGIASVRAWIGTILQMFASVTRSVPNE